MACLAPSAQSMIRGDQWSSQARNRFITLVHGCSVIVTLFSILHGVMRVHLHVSMETGDVSIADLLVKEGHARLSPETIESKVTAGKRRCDDVKSVLKSMTADHCLLFKCSPHCHVLLLPVEFS